MTLSAFAPVTFAEIVSVVTATEPLYESVTVWLDEVTVVGEIVNAPVVSVFVKVIGDA